MWVSISEHINTNAVITNLMISCRLPCYEFWCINAWRGLKLQVQYRASKLGLVNPSENVWVTKAKIVIKELPVFNRWQDCALLCWGRKMTFVYPQMLGSCSSMRSRQEQKSKMARLGFPSYWKDHHWWVFQSGFNLCNILCKKAGSGGKFTAVLLQMTFCLSLNALKQISSLDIF